MSLSLLRDLVYGLDSYCFFYEGVQLITSSEKKILEKLDTILQILTAMKSTLSSYASVDPASIVHSMTVEFSKLAQAVEEKWDALKAIIERIQQKIDELKGEFKQMKHEITEMMNSMKKFIDMIPEIKQDVGEMKKDVRTLIQLLSKDGGSGSY